MISRAVNCLTLARYARGHLTIASPGRSGFPAEIVAPEQLLAARHLVGSKECQIRTEVVPGTHLGLCMGATTLLHTWSKIARWLAAAS